MSRHLLRALMLVVPAALGLLLSACTGAAAPPTKPVQTWYVDPVRFQRGAHAGLQCVDCHITIPLSDIPTQHPNSDDVMQDAVTAFDYRACQRCHLQEYDAYARGVHAEVASGARVNATTYPAPTCGNCHSPHYDPPNRTRAALIASQVGTCGTCHPEEKETYRQNYHGKAAANLADTGSPACTDCHGGHTTVSLKETDAALQACQVCHPDASANMTGFLIHAQETPVAPDAPHAGESTLLFVAKILLTVFVVGVLGFFYAHTVIWLVRSAHNRMRGS